MAIESMRFELVSDWKKCPTGDEFAHEDVAAVACDSQGRIHLHTRRGDRVVVYQKDGKYIHRRGDGVFNSAHGITIAHDNCYCTDNADHVISVFDLEGNFKQKLGTPGVKSDTGHLARRETYEFGHNEAVGPFSGVCNAAVAANGDICATATAMPRIHHFDRDGKLLDDWGEVGAGRGSSIFRTASRSTAAAIST